MKYFVFFLLCFAISVVVGLPLNPLPVALVIAFVSSLMGTIGYAYVDSTL